MPRSIEKKRYQTAILDPLATREPGKTICPSEILPLAERKDKDKMEEVREAARGLVAEGAIEIVQKGEPVDPYNLKGPIRLRMKR